MKNLITSAFLLIFMAALFVPVSDPPVADDHERTELSIGDYQPQDLLAVEGPASNLGKHSASFDTFEALYAVNQYFESSQELITPALTWAYLDDYPDKQIEDNYRYYHTMNRPPGNLDFKHLQYTT